MRVARQLLSFVRVLLLAGLTVVALVSAAAWALSPTLAKSTPTIPSAIPGNRWDVLRLTVMPRLWFIGNSASASFFWKGPWEPWDDSGWKKDEWLETSPGYYTPKNRPISDSISFPGLTLTPSTRTYVRYAHAGDGPPVPEKYKGYSVDVYVQFWLLAVLCGAYPIVALLRRPARRRRIRRRMGQCVRCAYDLTGNTTGVCPECGTKVERS